MPFECKHCTQKEKDVEASIKLQLHLCSLELITCSRDAVRTPSEERTQKSQRQKAAVTAMTMWRTEGWGQSVKVEKSTSVFSVTTHSKSMLIQKHRLWDKCIRKCFLSNETLKTPLLCLINSQASLSGMQVGRLASGYETLSSDSSQISS